MRGVWTYAIYNLSDDLGGNIGLEMGFEKWKVAGDLLEVLSVNFTLNRRAARGCESFETNGRH